MGHPPSPTSVKDFGAPANEHVDQEGPDHPHSRKRPPWNKTPSTAASTTSTTTGDEHEEGHGLKATGSFTSTPLSVGPGSISRPGTPGDQKKRLSFMRPSTLARLPSASMSAAKKGSKATLGALPPLPKLTPASFRTVGSGRAKLSSPQSPEEKELGWVKVRVERAKGLAAKDRNGLSDPFVVLKVGAGGPDEGEGGGGGGGGRKVQSEVKWATLDPVWWTAEHGSSGAAELMFPVWPSTLGTERIEIVLFDKDKVGKDYLGECSLGVDEWFGEGWKDSVEGLPAVGWADPANASQWFHVQSSRKNSKVSGAICVRIGFLDPDDVPLFPARPHPRGDSPTRSFSSLADVAPSSSTANSHVVVDTQDQVLTPIELAHVVKALLLERADDLTNVNALSPPTTARIHPKRTASAGIQGKKWKQAATGVGRRLRRGGRGPKSARRGERVLTAPPTEGVGTTGAKGELAGKDLSAGIGMGDSEDEESDSDSDGSDTMSEGDDTDLDVTGGEDSPPAEKRESSAPPVMTHLSAPPAPGQGQHGKKGMSLPGFMRRTTTGGSTVASGATTPTTTEPPSITSSTTHLPSAPPSSSGGAGGGGGGGGKRFGRKKTPLEGPEAEAARQKRRELRKTRKRQRKLLRRKSDYSFSTGGDDDVMGLCFVEVKSATGLPKWRNMTRTGFDMDPFAIISFGQRVFRTRVIRHSLNPTWDEKLFFHVKRHEMTFTICVNVFDWDKLSSNDYVGECTLNMADLIAKAPPTDPETGLYRVDVRTGQLEADRLVEFDLPIEIAQKNELDATAGAGAATLHLRAKFTPYEGLRQVFWRRYMSQYDTDDSGTMSYVELFSMLDSLGSTLSKRTIESFFTRFGKTADGTLTEDEAVRCLEAELLKPREEKALVDSSTDSGMATPGLGGGARVNPLDSLSDNARRPLSYTGPNAIPFESPGPEAVEALDLEPFEEPALQPPPSITTAGGGHHHQHQHPSGLAGVTPSRAASMDEMMDAAAADSVERVINISRCPLCHKDRISSRLEVDLVTHLAVCASQDWSSLDRIPVGNFVTASQAQRKWVTKVIGLVQNGQYQLGANSANIIVQDRRTGKLLEEKMQVYVRAGIRLLYKGLGSSRMEGQRIRRLLHSMSVKQGLKYDAPESVKDIGPFVAFHHLDLNEILDPLDSFKTFNEFFYRKLKPDARPVADPEDGGTLVSCADCRMMAFATIGEATKVWIKGREFGVARLLGERYGKDSAAYDGGALAIFRLAPQDYHRFHSPVDGVVGELQHITGQYYTVNPMAIRSAVDVYGENVRMVVPIDTDHFGRVYSVHIGAMMVGSIVMTVKAGDRVARGQDIGYFAFGGSTIVTVFPENSVRWDHDLIDNSRASTETLVRVGMRVGKAVKGSTSSSSSSSTPAPAPAPPA